MRTSWFSRAFARAKNSQDLERKSATANTSQGFFAFQNMLDPGWTTATYASLARQGYMRNPIVHRCVRLIAESAAAVPWLLYDGMQELSEHPMLELIQRPNGHQSRTDLLEAVFGHLLLSGNAYLEYTPVHTVSERGDIFALRPDRVTCSTDEQGWPESYCYQIGTSKRIIPTGQGSESETILHLKHFNPLDDQSGFAPLQAALMALDTHNAAANWNKSLLDNAARPSGALVYAPGDGSNLNQEQYDKLKDELQNGYAGTANAGRPLLLEGGLDWKAMGLSPKDMDFIEAKNSASRDIALAFGVPPMLLGIPGDNTYANYQEAHRAFFRLTILPLLRRTTESIGAWLSPHFSQSLKFSIDLDQIESLSVEREALWSRLEGASFLSEDEKRLAVGYSPAAQGS